jgi:hypothetical protein
MNQGICLFYRGDFIAWSASEHAEVSRSNTEFEYKSLANATEESLLTAPSSIQRHGIVEDKIRRKGPANSSSTH